MTDIETLRLALELKNSASAYWTEKEISIIEKLIDLLKQAEQAEQAEQAQPVAWMLEGWGPDCGPYIEFYRNDEMGWRDRKEWTPLYTSPPPRQPLTDEQIQTIAFEAVKDNWNWLRFARAIEAALRQSIEQAEKQEPVTVLPDGSAFAVMSWPLPKDHWLYADRQYNDGGYEPVELGKPILTHDLRDAVVSAVRYAIRGATNCGKEVDFDPDALVQNAVYALCGPVSKAYTPLPPRQPLTDEQIWRLMRDNDPTVYEAFRLAEAAHDIEGQA